jgi:hypothetical protein
MTIGKRIRSNIRWLEEATGGGEIFIESDDEDEGMSQSEDESDMSSLL